jgi:hypothetical protein
MKSFSRYAQAPESVSAMTGGVPMRRLEAGWHGRGP